MLLSAAGLPSLDEAKQLEMEPSVQDMYTRLLSANLDFDSELQHFFWWELD